VGYFFYQFGSLIISANAPVFQTFIESGEKIMKVIIVPVSNLAAMGLQVRLFRFG